MTPIVSVDVFIKNVEFPECGDICERYAMGIFGSVEKIMDTVRDQIVAGKPIINIVINREQV